MKKKPQFIIPIMGSIIILFMLTILIYISVSIADVTWNQTIDEIENLTAQKASIISSVLRKNQDEIQKYSYFANMAFISFKDEYDAFSMIADMGKKLTASRGIYLREDGRIYSFDGELLDTDALSLIENLDKNTITNPFYDSSLNADVILIYCPQAEATQKTENKTGVRGVAGYYKASEIYASCSFLEEKNASEFYLIDKMGKILFSPHNKTGNISDVLLAINFENSMISEVQESLKTQVSGSFPLNNGSNKSIATIQPINSNDDFFAVTVVSNAEISSVSFQMTEQSILAGFIILACFIFVIIYSFISEKKNLKKVELVENYDKIASCPNQNLFEIELEKILKERPTTKYALLYINIQNFKFINKVFGYKISNRIIASFSDILRKEIKRNEIYGRLSDGRLIMLVAYTSEYEIVERFHYISKKIDIFHSDEGEKVKVKLTAGIFCLDRTISYTPMGMIDRSVFAQQAIQYEKGNDFAFFTQKDQDVYIENLHLEQQLEQALENDEFKVYFQPKYNILQNRLDSAEALVRWIRPSVGVIPPDDFIPLCERSGFVSDIDKYVFEKVCAMLKKCKESGQRTVPISVNISRAVLQSPDFIERYISMKNKYDIADNYIELEFTESIAFEDYLMIPNTIAELQKNGFLCSIDDFGSGFSSFKALKAMTFDCVKIDRYFLPRESDKKRSEYMLTGLIALAKYLDMKVVMEGVEYQEELNLLKKLKCDIIQGFIYARPMKEEDFLFFINKEYEKPSRMML